MKTIDLSFPAREVEFSLDFHASPANRPFFASDGSIIYESGGAALSFGSYETIEKIIEFDFCERRK